MYAGVVLHHETKQTFHQSEMKFKGWIKSYLLLTVRSWHFYLIASENLLVSWKIFTQGPPQDPGNVGSLDHMFFGWWIRSTPAQYASGQSTAGPRIHHQIVRSLSRMRSCSFFWDQTCTGFALCRGNRIPSASQKLQAALRTCAGFPKCLLNDIRLKNWLLQKGRKTPKVESPIFEEKKGTQQNQVLNGFSDVRIEGRQLEIWHAHGLPWIWPRRCSRCG